MQDTPPPTNGRPGYKDLYEAINGLRAELRQGQKEVETRILDELAASEARGNEALHSLKLDIRSDILEEREAREELAATVTEIRDRVWGAAAVIAVLVIVVNWLGASNILNAITGG